MSLKASREPWENSPKIWASKLQESNLTTRLNNAKYIFSKQQQPELLKSLFFSASSQFVHPPLNQRTGVTAVTRLPATASHRKQSSSTSVMRATLWRATTSSSPAKMASGTVPCRLAADSHKVCLSQPHAGNVNRNLWTTFTLTLCLVFRRQGAQLSTGYTSSVYCDVHS